eukprot:g50663.t1
MFLALDDIIEVIEIEFKMQNHVDDVKVDSLEDYQHMLQALYGEELAQHDQGNVPASDSGAEQSDQESSRRRHKRLPKQVLESQWQQSLSSVKRCCLGPTRSRSFLT